MANSLPPSKRFKLLHQAPPPPTSFCLPAKKRIWAPPPLSPKNIKATQNQQQESEEEEEEEDGIVCAVCNSTDGDPKDPIVFCDGCDLTVHASCYGNPLSHSIPDHDWFCCVCKSDSDSNSNTPPECCLCPGQGGAMKRTTAGGWAHIVCAVFVPEVFFREPEGRDGVDLSRVPIRRWREECCVCGRRCGCVVECAEPKCGLGFHVTCGLERELCLEYREEKGGGVVVGFCRDHTKLWKKQQLTGKYKIVAREQQRGKRKRS